jgi:D-alanyl-D-alanine dipeptidase
VKQYFKKPIKTIAITPALASLACLVAFAVLASCESDGGTTSFIDDIPSSRIGTDPREIIMLLPLEAPTGNPLVVLTDQIPNLQVDLRYAKANNVARRRLYDRSMPAMLDAPTVKLLANAQQTLLSQGYTLKVWDAYRPPGAHLRLWQRTGKSGYVADPRWGWSKHCSGRAVDVTLANAETGKELEMPSKFDDFSKNASSNYTGKDREVLRRVTALRRAMLGAGFVGIDMEWWHFENADKAQLNLPPIYADEAGVNVPN